MRKFSRARGAAHRPTARMSAGSITIVSAVLTLVSAALLAGAPSLAVAASRRDSSVAAPSASREKAEAIQLGAPSLAVTATGEGPGSLESAASKAGETGRKVAMSLIALGFAIASIVLAFRRDFREAAGVFAVGLVAIVLATPAGINVLRDTVNSLFGGS